MHDLLRNLLLRNLAALSLFSCLATFAVAQDAEWKIGVSRVNITPPEPIFMAGYASRNKPYESVHDELFAIGDTCTHEEFSLSDGEMVDEFTIECPLHGARYDVRSGRALCLPAVLATPSYPVWVEDGVIKLDFEEP